MKATDKQVSYLQFLADKVEAIKQLNDPRFKTLPTWRDWSNERKAGLTKSDASAKITAFKSIIRNINAIKMICNEKQF